MTVTALEVSLNGKVLYTVGMEGWQHLGASIHGHRHTKEMMEQIAAQTDGVPPDHGAHEMEWVRLTSHVGIPDTERPGHSSAQEYGLHQLKVGDEVTVRVVQTELQSSL